MTVAASTRTARRRDVKKCFAFTHYSRASIHRDWGDLTEALFETKAEILSYLGHGQQRRSEVLTRSRLAELEKHRRSGAFLRNEEFSQPVGHNQGYAVIAGDARDHGRQNKNSPGPGALQASTSHPPFDQAL